MTDAAASLPLTAERLARAAAVGRRVPIWWRDDDARVPSAALDRLVNLRRTAGVPLALAVIPEGSGPALAERLAGEADVLVLQHGLAHKNHAPSGEKRAEFGDHRPIDAMLAELASGRRHLEALFGDRFLPVFVPPWNRIGAALAARLAEAGLGGLSVFADAAPGGTRPVNAHLDLIDWHPGPKKGQRPGPQGLTVAVVDGLLADLIDRRLAPGDIAPAQDVAPVETRPIGLLTHHLQHDETAWATLEIMLRQLAMHPAIVWPRPSALLALGKCGRSI